MWREFRFHKGRSMLLLIAVTLVSMLCTFSFALGFTVRDGLIYSYQIRYGSTSHILYYGLDSAQAASIARHADVKKTVRLRAVGLLSDDMMEYRSVKLAAVDNEWAAATEAVPVHGRMPEADDEIAMDELTLQSLAIPRKEGAKVQIRWMPADGSEERVDTFRLCGWWGSSMGYTETCAWITPDAARKLCPDAPDYVTLGVTLYRPRNLDAQAQEMLHELGADQVSYTTNLAYNKARLHRLSEKTIPFYLINIAVVVCGILMVYNIVRISETQNMRFYGRVKSLGMSPRQIRRFSSEQAAYLCLPAIPVGWLLGFALYAVAAPYVILGTGGYHPAILFHGPAPFVCSALLTWLTAYMACTLPARLVSGISPAEAMKLTDLGTKIRNSGRKIRHDKMERERTRSHRYRKEQRRIRVPLMALSGMKRDRKKSILAAASMFLSLTLLCGFWTQYISTDEEKYMREISYCDYLIADASAASDFQRYNPASHSITPEFMEAVAGHEAVTGTGTLRTMEVPMYADEEERALIVENFESAGEDGMIRKEFMSGDPDWMNGYKKFRTSGEYIGIVSGVDGLAASVMLSEGEYIEGTYDEERFATGDYVIAAGASTTSFITTPPIGSKVEIGGRFFEIMASVSYQGHVIAGADSREAAFNISYYMPAWTFEELFPDSGIRNVLVNIDYNSQEEFENFLSEMIRDTGIAVTMRSDQQWGFKNALFHNYVIPMFVGTVLLVIGILNFGNALVTGVLVRKKEMAVYESLGMTRRQIRRLLICEGLLYGGMMTVFLVPAVAILTWLWTGWWAAYSASAWCVTWQYSLLPMWVTLPILFVLVLTIPLCCLHMIMKESVTERLQVAE